MKEKDFHKDFRDYVPISLLFAAFEKSYPHFRKTEINRSVDDRGKPSGRKVFLTLKKFSTDFPHLDVKEKPQ